MGAYSDLVQTPLGGYTRGLVVAFNIIARSLVVLVGVMVLLNVPELSGIEPTARMVFGSTILLFGIYRILSFLRSQRTVDGEGDHLPMVLWVVLLPLFLTSCSNDTDSRADSAAETALRGSAEILVDEQIYSLLLDAKALYDAAHPEAKITFIPRNAASIADDIINHRSRGAVIARTWLPVEDSAVLADRGEEGFPRTLIARDALVFYTARSFPLDTLNVQDIETWLAGGTVDSDVYPALPSAPTFVVPGAESSIYGNVMLQILQGAQPAAGSIAALPTMDSIRLAVRASDRLIGIGYLSQFVGDSTVKLLRLSYTNAKGEYIRPKPVHAAYVIMGTYPYPVPIYVVLKDRVSNYSLPSGFAQFMAMDGGAQRSFFDHGIEPGYAKIELVLPED